MTAPVWLRESFRDGVDEIHAEHLETARTIEEACQLAPLDPFSRPCTGNLERFHWIGRQRVRNALYALLPSGQSLGWNLNARHLIVIAEWDARNGGIGCEGHHRPFDSHLMPPLLVPRFEVPDLVEEFIADWGLEAEAERKFSESPTRVVAR